MKGGLFVLLVISHLAAGALGWMFWRGEEKEGAQEQGDAPVRVEPSAKRATPENPILRATSADFRGVWARALKEGKEPGTMLFIDWCERDPEAAILALREFYAPQMVSHYLRLAATYYAAEMAEPLVRHWRELKFVPENDLVQIVGWTLGTLAGKEPERATALLHQLPSGMRTESYDRFLSNLKKEQQEVAVRECLKLVPGYSRKEQEEFYRDLARGVRRAGVEEGCARWLPLVESEYGVQQLAGEFFRGAHRQQNWENFFETVNSLEGEQREWTEATIAQAGVNFGSPGGFVPFLAACETHGRWDLVERMVSTHGEEMPVDPPQEFLTWAMKLDPGAEAPFRQAVRYALRSDPSQALNWLRDQPPGTKRDQVVKEAMEHLEVAEQEGWASLLASDE